MLVWHKNKKRLNYFILFILALFSEIFLFNFSFFESLSFVPCSQYEINIGEGLEYIQDDLFLVKDSASAYVELNNIDNSVKNIYFNSFPTTQEEKDYAVTKIRIEATDSASSKYYTLPETEIINGIKGSMYKRLHLNGVSAKLKINFINCNDWVVRINRDSIGINVLRPFQFNIIRFITILIILLICFDFRLKSAIYSERIDFSSVRHKRVVFMGILFHVVFICGISIIFANKYWEQTTWLADLQYNYMAESLLHGHTWLEFDVPDVLKEMDNPYDTALRGQLLAEAGQDIIVDFAYYNGKYYSCFGIIPVVLFYIPYLLITGKQLYSGTLIMIAGIGYIIVTFWFIYSISKKYFKDLTLGIYLVLASMFIAASGILYCIQMSGIYTVPIMLSLLFDLFGITCWLNSFDRNEKVNRFLLLIGAISLALSMGCRLQLAIAFILAFPIFWNEIKKGYFFTKKGFLNTSLVITPFLIVGCSLLAFNYVRFGSLFEFGAKFNLTGFDMVHRQYSFSRFFLGFFEYLFQPFYVNAKYPYVYTVANHMYIATDFMGQTINEPFLAGFFAFNPICLLVLFGKKAINKRKDASLKGLFFLPIAFALIALAVDIQVVGITFRYMSDYSIWLCISTILVILAMMEDGKKECVSLVIALVVVLTAFTMITNYYSLFASGRYNELMYASPKIYYGVKYIFS